MTALITGSNKGIGFEIARQLAQRGCNVWITGRDSGRLDRAAQQLQSAGSVRTLLLDVSDSQSIQHAAKTFLDAGQELDVLINNAAILLREDQSLVKNHIDVWTRTMRTNVEGPLLVSRAFLPAMKSGGRIIMMSSGGGSMTDPVGGWSPTYCVSKTMLNGLTRQLAHELAARKILVNAVCPGWVQTDMGGAGAPRAISKGAETPVWLASEEGLSTTGKFFRDKKVIPW